MRFILIVISLMLSLPALAQSDPNSTGLQNIGNHRNPSSGLGPISRGATGSPLLFDESPKGDLIMTNGKIHGNIYINIYPEKAQIVILSGDGEDAKEVVVDNKKVEKIIYNKPERTFVPMKIEGKTHIAEIIYEGRSEKLIAIHEKKFKRAGVEGVNAGYKNDTYQHLISYFIINESSAVELKKGKAGLKILAKEEWKSLQNFAKSNNLDMGNPIDMRLIYMHSLEL